MINLRTTKIYTRHLVILTALVALISQVALSGYTASAGAPLAAAPGNSAARYLLAPAPSVSSSVGSPCGGEAAFSAVSSLLGRSMFAAPLIFDSCIAPSFAGATNFPVDDKPRSIGVADFNNDTHLDLAVVNQSPNNVSILLGNGAGGFTPATPPTVAAGTNPRSVAIADFDADGKADDLAIANSSSNNVSIRLGDGTGGFTSPLAPTPANITVGASPHAVAAGDVNNDGAADIVVVNRSSNNVSVLLNTGPGAFTPATGSPFAVGTQPYALVMGSFDANPGLDLAVANEGSNNVTILTNNGSGTFTAVVPVAPLTNPVPVGSTPRAIAAGDFDGDTDTDLAVANSSGRTVSILSNNGAAGFSVTSTHRAAPPGSGAIQPSPSSIAVSDFNGDNKLDLVVTSEVTNIVAVLLGTGTGGINSFPGNATTFGGVTFTAGTNPRFVNVTDFNGDTRPDLAVANAGTAEDVGADTVSILLNTCGLADLALSKSDANAIFTVGGNGTYTLTVTNTSTEAPSSGTITVTDTLPAGLTFVSGTGTGWNCSADGQTVTCTTSDPLANGASSAITLTVAVNSAAYPSVTNTASVANANDIGAANNSASDTTIVNRPPVADAQSVTTAEDVVGGVAVTLAAADPDGNSLTFSVVDAPASGTLGTLGAPSCTSGNCTAAVTYTPNANYSGTDTFTFKTNDGISDSNTATVTITVSPVNDQPTTTPQSLATDEDTPLVINLTGADVDGETLAFTVDSGPTSGSLGAIGTPSCPTTGGTSNCTAAVTYTPNANFNGADSFTFRVTDGSATFATATVSITVNAVNDPPVANADSYSVGEDATLTVPLAMSVLTNDTDVESSPLTAALATNVSNGALTLNADGSFTYTPNANFNGSDSFTYRANDGAGNSASPATVTITVNATNDVPVASDQSVTTEEEVAKLITLGAVDVDGNTLSYSVVAGPTQGTLTGTGANLTYTPAADYTGPDSFTFKVNDNTGEPNAESNTATVSITVIAFNDPPVADGQTLTTNEDTPLGVTLTATDIDNTTLSYIVVAGPTNGTLTGTGANLTYTPAAHYNGPDSFTFKANDGEKDSNVATISLTVNAVNDVPVAVNDAHSVNVNNTLTVFAPGVIANDGDVEGSALMAALVNTTTNGVLTFNADGSFSYQPNENYSGPDSFTYTVSDGTATSIAATVSITVIPLTDLAIVKADSGDPVASGSSLTYTLTATNNGPSAATGVTVTDTLPASATYSSASASKGTCTGTGPVVCTIGDLASGESATVTVAIFTPTAPGVISNTASVTGDQIDPNTSNNSDTEPTTIFFDTCATPNFTAAVNYTTTSRPESVTAGDFNGDGKADLAVVNRNSSPGKVSVFLNTGAGSFGSKTDYPVGSTPRFVAQGDFNGDTKLDLAVANRNDNNVAILLGTGTGSFSAATNFGVGTNPFGIGVGDFNSDTKLDLAVANENSTNVSILIGDGAGGFSAATNYTVGSSPRAVAVGDYNGDTKPDLAVANFSTKNVSILLNNGTGGFGAATNFTTGTGLGPTSIATGDLDNDGDLDLAAAVEGTNSVSILSGNGTGGFAAPISHALGGTPKSIAVGDFNTNGKVDLAVANGSNVSVLEGDGMGGFGTPANFATGTSAWSVFVGDLSGDGRLDMAVANAGSNNVSVLLNSCGAADLVITKTHTGNFTVGVDGVYNLMITNVGSNSTFGTITVTDTLPTGMSYVSATSPDPGWNCSASGQTVTCTNTDHPITAGASNTITLTVGVAAAAAPSKTNTVTISNSSDINAANNSASDPTTVTPAANLSLTMTDSPDPVAVDNNLTYTLTVTNTGLSNASGIAITDTLPANATLISYSASKGSGCTTGTGTVTCNIGTLNVNISATMTVVIKPTATGMITNSATVTGTELDPDTANNTVTQETNVVLGGDLSITKSAAPNPVNVGSNVTYTITVSTTGQTATDVVVTDNLPASLTYVSCSATLGGVCGGTNNNRTVTFASLADGATATITLVATVKVPATNGSTISNTASVSASSPDPNTVNNVTPPSVVTVNAPIASVDPMAINFGNVPLTTTSAPLTVTVTNTGAAPLTFSSITLAGMFPGDYKIASNTCSSASVAPSASCVIGVQFAPLALGGRNASLRLDTNASPASYFVALDGRGVSPTATAWGSNTNGQLGDGTTATKRTPVQVIGFTAGAKFKGGATHSLGLKPDGTVWAWGVNTNGQLGDGTTLRRLAPVQVKGAGGIGFLTDVTAIAAGDKFSLALKSDGTVWGWGYNSSGQLGDGTTTQRITPVQVKGAGGVGFLTDVIAIAGGANHSIALKSDGTVWAWGINNGYQLGDNTTTRRLTPVQVMGVGGVNFLGGISTIAAGANHNLAIRASDGAVIAWGLNSSGQIGNNSSSAARTPVEVLGEGGTGLLTGVIAIAGGTNHSIALRDSDDRVFTWGSNNNGQLGDGSTTTRRTPTRLAAGPAATGVRDIAAGANHSFAIRASDGAVFAWGSNSAGQLGSGSTASRSLIPVNVVTLSGIARVAAGANHSLAAQ